MTATNFVTYVVAFILLNIAPALSEDPVRPDPNLTPGAVHDTHRPPVSSTNEISAGLLRE
jgi:hypothetical protein